MLARVHRALTSPEQARDLAARIDAAHGPFTPDVSAKMNLLSLTPDDAGFAAKAALAQHILIWFWSGPLPAVAAGLLGAQPVLLNTHCTARHQAPRDPAENVAWHLDANFWGFETPLLTIWLSLTPSGRDARGLELALPYSRPTDSEMERAYLPVARAKREAGRPISVTDDEMAAMIGPVRTRAPAMAPGDALIFDQTVLHRTQLDGTATRPRLAVEFRIAPRSPLPAAAATDMASLMTSFVDPASGRAVQARLGDLPATA